MAEPRVRAPALPEGGVWYNTPGPLQLSQLRGRVVLLDFWTYGCINCQHILPELAGLEARYGDRLVVIGVHSPKFPMEQVAGQLGKAIERLDIRHPVVNDPSLKTWRDYAIRAWPSVAVIDARGYLAAVFRGEGHGKALEALVARLVAEAGGVIARHLPVVQPATKPDSPLALYYPSKLWLTAERLYISDTGRHRVVEAGHDGRVSRLFGGDEAGYRDGAGPQALFQTPRGLTGDGQALYVADSGNHVIRRINLADGRVGTVAGTGQQARKISGEEGAALATPLNTPWDLAYRAGRLLIAAAGSHLVQLLDLEAGTLGLLAGCGREDLVDGAPGAAAFAQPSGLAVDGETLYVADAESSAIRQVSLINGRVQTLVGEDLFDFGDRDGPASQARLQHPLALSYDPDRHGLWVADSYNNKLKYIALKRGMVSGFPLDRPLDEPGGIQFFNGDLWVANTNAHEILRIRLESGISEVVRLYD